MTHRTRYDVLHYKFITWRAEVRPSWSSPSLSGSGNSGFRSARVGAGSFSSSKPRSMTSDRFDVDDARDLVCCFRNEKGNIHKSQQSILWFHFLLISSVSTSRLLLLLNQGSGSWHPSLHITRHYCAYPTSTPVNEYFRPNKLPSAYIIWTIKLL